MTEGENKMQFLNQLIASLKKIENDQHTTVEHLAKVQMEVQQENQEDLSNKINEVFANASKNTKLLHEIIDKLTINRNRLRSGN